MQLDPREQTDSGARKHFLSQVSLRKLLSLAPFRDYSDKTIILSITICHCHLISCCWTFLSFLIFVSQRSPNVEKFKLLLNSHFQSIIIGARARLNFYRQNKLHVESECFRLRRNSLSNIYSQYWTFRLLYWNRPVEQRKSTDKRFVLTPRKCFDVKTNTRSIPLIISAAGCS